MELKEIRLGKRLTQEAAAKLLNITRRTYIKYEKNEIGIDNFKLKYYCEVLNNYNLIDEEHGVLSIEEIKKISSDIFKQYDVEYAYLFGSYSRNEAKENSDIDILVAIPIDGLKFYGLIESLRDNLKKRIDLLDLYQLENNFELTKDILKDGIKIYEKGEKW